MTALRVSLLEPAACEALYSATWVDGLDTGDDEVLRSVLNKADFDAEDLLSRCNEPEVRNALRRNTERARSLGLYGVPTWLINNDIACWGQDRIDHVARALAGWRPSSEHESPVTP